MKDKQIIDKLLLLKSVQPDSNTLRLIRKQIPSQPEENKDLSFNKRLTVPSFIPIGTFAIAAVILAVMIGFFPYGMNNIFVNAKIAFASNHYEKAKIAIANVQTKFSSLQKNTTDTNKVILLSDSMSLANKEMSGLQLAGEEGKYTSDQCEELYKSYHNELGKIEKTFDSPNDTTDKSLLLQAMQYDKQAENKLQNYKTSTWKENSTK